MYLLPLVCISIALGIMVLLVLILFFLLDSLLLRAQYPREEKTNFCNSNKPYNIEIPSKSGKVVLDITNVQKQKMAKLR